MSSSIKFVPKVGVTRNGSSTTKNTVENFYSLKKERGVLGIITKEKKKHFTFIQVNYS